jgi:hypothetical protein
MHKQMYRLAETAAARKAAAKKQERASLAECSAEDEERTGPAAAAARPRLKKPRTKAEAIAARKAGHALFHEGDWTQLRGVPVTSSGAEAKLAGKRASAATQGDPPRTACGTQLAPAGFSEADVTPAQSAVRKFACAPALLGSGDRRCKCVMGFSPAWGADLPFWAPVGTFWPF